MKRFFGLRGNSLNVAAILGVLMPGVLSFGYNSASIGGVLSFRSFGEHFPAIDIANAENKGRASSLQGFVVACFPIGAFLGALACVWLGDWLGRRRVIMLGTTAQILGCMLSASAFHMPQLVLSRIIVGVGAGSSLAAIPLWITEISPTEKRGSHVVTKGIFSGLGCAMVLFIEFGMSFKKDSSISWRLPLGFSIILSLVVLGCIAFLPESPRWLIQKSRTSEAMEVLSALGGANADDDKIQSTIVEVQASLALSHEKAGWKQLFQMGTQRTLHRAFLAILVLLFLQLTGSPPTTIFENNLGLNESTARLLAAFYQVVGPIGGTLCVFLVEGFGRRRMMFTSAIGNCICLVCIASLGSQVNNIAASHAAVFFIFLFHVSYVNGFGGIPYLYAAEVSPLHLRSTITSISVSATWALTFRYMGQKYFYVYASLNALIAPIVYFLYPETSGRSLEEIDDIFTLSKGFLDTVKVAKKLPHMQASLGKELPSQAKLATILKEKELEV
ncbi:hypothetical protein N7468_009541 [Penicillium chermesinum]|uniref:Major facilitator superfamily (MFS) profile domain-containing protein n=1 Tax=Penicillium chermesinum TaxID=63820 RepID=A0A9W9TEY0_9EURO|nr:uncharacterized protein N7468_009541 [Penicillium chermesinum]KAJ5220337.1 hypothetical protein N7468_009541 [Penicillium chermesinum]